jgi:superfamily I DNA/RNA helicase
MNYIFLMQFTDEQEAVFAASGDIKINAVAGSGKTTVLVEFARRQRPGTKILYIAFNRSVRLSAQQRFAEQKLINVDIQTAHSLAFRRIAIPANYTIAKGYKIPDIVKMLDLRPIGRDPHSAYLIAGHILKFAAFFCNSAKSKIRDLDYRETVTDAAAAKTVGRWYDAIEKGTRLFLAKMDRKEVDATHDFYLKKYQLANPVLNYDLIMFDEGQDASPVMLDVFLAQRARKVIVGDRFQQIYGWRRAINALTQIDFTEHSLTASFRFNRHIAALAMECLRWKELLGETVDIRISGLGTNNKIRTRATLARTNLALLKRAIDTVQHDRSIKSVYFEGNISSYTYASDGASIYDVLNLYLDKRDRIRDPLIGAMTSFEDLEEFAEKSEDMELRMLIDIVAAYGKQIPALLKKITGMHVDDDKREKADMIFSTLHRCKGMEYDAVTMAEDFITGERIRKMVAKEGDTPLDRTKLSEEINVAYVAITRSRNFLDFPDAMFPGADKSLFAKKSLLHGFPKAKGSGKYAASASKHERVGNQGLPWTVQHDDELRRLYLSETPQKDLAEYFKRKPGAIRARLKKLGLIEE